MSAKDLKSIIDSLARDIEFSFGGIDGSICPFSRTNIAFSYGDTSVNFSSIEDLMDAKVIGGRSLAEVSDKLTIY